MIVELIPVIEITCFGTDVPMPEGPYWNYRKEWDEYHAACFVKAGFPDTLVPYSPGSSFFKFNDISDANLKKIILDQTDELREEGYDWEYDGGSGRPFYGGYVLRVDGEDKYFPQCCCDLSYIYDWEGLLTDKWEHFYAGHPSPSVKLNDGIITFDFTNPTPNEPFANDVPDEQVSFDIELLRQALDKAKNELNEFAGRLIHINESEKLGIPNIDKYLIWNGTHL